MYAIQSLTRIYAFILLCLCAALFSVPSLAITKEQYYKTELELYKYAQNGFKPVDTVSNVSSVSPASGSLGTSSSGSLVSKKTGANWPVAVQRTINTAAARAALQSAMRLNAYAAAGYAVYEAASGINDWLNNQGLEVSPDGTIYQAEFYAYQYDAVPADSYNNPAGSYGNSSQCVSSIPSQPSAVIVDCFVTTSGYHHTMYCPNPSLTSPKVPFSGFLKGTSQQNYRCIYLKDGSGTASHGGSTRLVPVTYDQLDYDSYTPNNDDLPVLMPHVDKSDVPFTISLSSDPVVTEGAVSTQYDAFGNPLESTQTRTTESLSVKNNNSTSPQVVLNQKVTQNTYNSAGQLVSSTETVSNSEPSELNQLTTGCALFDPFCKWSEWTQEPLDEQEPDLVNLISEFEPDEGGYSSGIGLGSCPAPMSLNLGIVNRVVEVSYQPFCDFLAMIRPLVIAGAWLLSAFMYVGVLRRG